MKPVWEIDGDDVAMLQGNSPEFVRFLNELLSLQAHDAKLPDVCVHLNQKDNEADGGVDAVVDQAIPPNRDPTGRFSVPTCWQFRARPAAKAVTGKKGGQQAALRQAIKDPHVSKLVAQGYGYRFCLADDMPHEKKKQWEGWLLEGVREIDSNAPAPMVLTASDLALWANHFKPVVINHFRSYLGDFHSLGTWQKQIASLTPKFVAIEGWEAAVRTIREHVDFSRRVTAVLPVDGEAGVGKTRCVCESLHGDAASSALVVYTEYEQKALEFAQRIARDHRAGRAILVADECTRETQGHLRELLPACADRLRVIAIDNSLKRAGGAGEVHLVRISDDEVETILERNFPDLPLERRLGYARLARGFVRLAVDLCQNDALVPAGGRVDSVFGFFHDFYLENRLSSEAEREAVFLISLLSRVGFRDDLAGQLEGLYAHPRIDLCPTDVLGIAQRLRHSPGFIAVGGRFLYVTPMLIAQVAFQSAWDRWIAPDPRRFLSELPTELIDPFVERVQSAGTDAMKEVVLDFFLDWVSNLGPPDLGREEAVSRLVHLIEAQPVRLVSLQRQLVERASLDELRQRHSGYRGEKARRELVWLAEKLAYFAEYFTDAEAILFRLALAETESHLGNSATRVWTALFRIMLSGTPVPFTQRLRLLEERLRGSDHSGLTLALGALDEILADGPVSRLATPPVVFGRFPPPEWRPADHAERRACRGLALAMAARLASADGPIAEGVRATAIKCLSPLLLEGYIEEAKTVIGPAPLPDVLLAAVTRELEDFLDVFCRDHHFTIHRTKDGTTSTKDDAASSEEVTETRPRAAGSDLETRVRDWYQSLIPSDLHSRLISVVGQDSWHQQLRGDSLAWQSALDELAAELLRSPTALDRELGWLCSPEARSAFFLGQALGQADEEGRLLNRMLCEIPLAGGSPLARGYLDRLATAHPRHLGRANDLLDRLEAAHPRTTYDLLWSAGDEVFKVPRLFRMVDTGGLPAEFLRGLVYGARRALQTDELIQALERLIRAAQSSDGRAAHAAVHLLYSHLHSPKQAAGVHLLRSENRLREMLPQVLELAFDAMGQEPNFWIHLVDDLAAVDPDRAICLTIRALMGDQYEMRLLAEERLVRFAGSYPEEVMRRLGEAMLRPVTGWRFHVHDFSRLLGSLPAETVRRWLDEAGVEGARGLARHLKSPHLDDEGQPVVPPLTAFVLDRFADDDQVFHEFCAGARSMHAYRGDFPAHLDRKAELARHFLRHPLKRLRDWARSEIEFARRESAFWRQHEEEMVIP
jgi:hypothetical protein